MVSPRSFCINGCICFSCRIFLPCRPSLPELDHTKIFGGWTASFLTSSLGNYDIDIEAGWQALRKRFVQCAGTLLLFLLPQASPTLSSRSWNFAALAIGHHWSSSPSPFINTFVKRAKPSKISSNPLEITPSWRMG